jgi:hypothetical protein
MKKAETAFEASNEKIALLESLDSDLSHELPLIRSQDFDEVKIKENLKHRSGYLPFMELGGTVIYDSKSNIFGCKKIERYFEESRNMPGRIVNPYLLFSK